MSLCLFDPSSSYEIFSDVDKTSVLFEDTDVVGRCVRDLVTAFVHEHCPALAAPLDLLLKGNPSSIDCALNPYMGSSAKYKYTDVMIMSRVDPAPLVAYSVGLPTEKPKEFSKAPSFCNAFFPANVLDLIDGEESPCREKTNVTLLRGQQFDELPVSARKFGVTVQRTPLLEREAIDYSCGGASLPGLEGAIKNTPSPLHRRRRKRASDEEASSDGEVSCEYRVFPVGDRLFHARWLYGDTARHSEDTARHTMDEESAIPALGRGEQLLESCDITPRENQWIEIAAQAPHDTNPINGYASAAKRFASTQKLNADPSDDLDLDFKVQATLSPETSYANCVQSDGCGAEERLRWCPAIISQAGVGFSLAKRDLTTLRIVGQAACCYIICVTTEGMVLCADQHAVDERCQLEKIRQSSKSIGKVNCELLSTPIRLSISSDEEFVLRSCKELFYQWGFRYDITTSNEMNSTVCATHVPVIHGEHLTILDMMEFANNILRYPNQPRFSMKPPAMHRIAASKACRSAIKFGARLSRDSCVAMLSDLAETQFPFQCAHGRPSIVPLVELSRVTHDRENIKRPCYGGLSAEYF